jgi:hypothetical protein
MNRWIRLSVGLAISLAFACDADDEVSAETDTVSGDAPFSDEHGVWTMTAYSLDGAAYEDLAPSRKKDLLMRFDADSGRLAVASCHVTEGPIVHEDLNAGGCITNTSLASWYCNCFAYEYEGDQMLWQEFAPDATPPETVEVSSGAVIVHVAEVDGVQDREFGPAPLGLWESDGATSRYHFLQKATFVWDDPKYGLDGPLLPADCAASCSLGTSP